MPDTVLIVFPTLWDAPQLASCRDRWADVCDVAYAGPPDEERPWDFDVLGFIEEVAARRGRFAGVTSSSDYPGATVAAAIAARRGLPGPSPESVLRCSHKYYARLAQREAVPEATPRFALVDPRDPGAVGDAVGFPCFVKPVKGAFSMMSRRVEGPEDLAAFLARPALREFLGRYMQPFNRLLAALSPLTIDGGHLIAEELLRGRQATVDGWVRGDEVAILGVVDSILHPRTGSFERFELPSTLPAAVQDRMGSIARRVVRHLGLRDALFNIEMIHDPATDAVSILEINPRISGQFGDLHQAVSGHSSYEAALALALGRRPPPPAGAAPRGAACSVPLRLYRPARVERVPTEAERRAVEARHPGTRVWVECAAGERLTDFERMEDGHSCRYGVVNTRAGDRDALAGRVAAVLRELDVRLTPLD